MRHNVGYRYAVVFGIDLYKAFQIDYRELEPAYTFQHIFGMNRIFYSEIQSDFVRLLSIIYLVRESDLNIF